MRLTKFSDLALRAVMHLAVAEPGAVFTTRELAVAVDAPYSHVAKVVTRLQGLGAVEARRGRGGGVELSPTARGRSVGALVRELEGEGDVVGCEDDPCPLRAECRLRGALRRAQEAFYTELDGVTVDDLITPPARRLLLTLQRRRPD